MARRLSRAMLVSASLFSKEMGKPFDPRRSAVSRSV
jgi:hypothetical protein